MDFPEEERFENNIGMTFYGETSYENQMAVLSHYLHNNRKDIDKDEQAEIVEAIRNYLSRKEMRQGIDISDWSDEQVLMAAEETGQHDLFSEFFNVPFPAPENPKFTFIDLLKSLEKLYYILI